MLLGMFGNVGGLLSWNVIGCVMSWIQLMLLMSIIVFFFSVGLFKYKWC